MGVDGLIKFLWLWKLHDLGQTLAGFFLIHGYIRVAFLSYLDNGKRACTLPLGVGLSINDDTLALLDLGLTTLALAILLDPPTP